jgi:hypothetical protein
MISANTSRKLVKKVASVTALFQKGLDRLVVATTRYHGGRLTASLHAAYDECERLENHAHVLQAHASAAYTESALADVAVTELADAVEAELDALGLYNA